MPGRKKIENDSMSTFDSKRLAYVRLSFRIRKLSSSTAIERPSM